MSILICAYVIAILTFALFLFLIYWQHLQLKEAVRVVEELAGKYRWKKGERRSWKGRYRGRPVVIKNIYHGGQESLGSDSLEISLDMHVPGIFGKTPKDWFIVAPGDHGRAARKKSVKLGDPGFDAAFVVICKDRKIPLYVLTKRIRRKLMNYVTPKGWEFIWNNRSSRLTKILNTSSVTAQDLEMGMAILHHVSLELENLAAGPGEGVWCDECEAPMNLVPRHERWHCRKCGAHGDE